MRALALALALSHAHAVALLHNPRLTRPVARPTVAARMTVEPSVALEQISNVIAFSDQGGNLAGTFFQFSLPSYLVFLYFLNYEKNQTPKLAQFGFQFLLLFVISTIPTGIISKSVYGCTLADSDWLHGSAEALLTVTNLLIVSAFRAASSGNKEGAEGALVRNIALAFAAVVAVVCGTGTSIGFEAHTPFLFGLGNLDGGAVASLPWAAYQEPVNALSLPTWAVHFSSVFEFLFAMQLVWKYAEVTGNEKWKGLTWGMLPLHASGVAACTYHFFYNPSSLQFLVELQAFLTLVGNTTLAIAALRIALSNGWTISQLNPFSKEEDSMEQPLQALKTSPAENELMLIGQLAALTFGCAYAVKYGELALGGVGVTPFGGNPILAGMMVLIPPVLVANAYLKAGGADDSSSASIS